MTDQLRLGTLGDEIFGGRAPSGDAVLQGGLSIPTPRQGDGMTVPIPLAAAFDDLPLPPPPFHGGALGSSTAASAFLPPSGRERRGRGGLHACPIRELRQDAVVPPPAGAAAAIARASADPPHLFSLEGGGRRERPIRVDDEQDELVERGAAAAGQLHRHARPVPVHRPPGLEADDAVRRALAELARKHVEGLGSGMRMDRSLAPGGPPARLTRSK